MALFAIAASACSSPSIEPAPSPPTESALAFFNDLSIVLDIELDRPAQRVSEHLENLAADPNARILSISARTEVLEGETFRELTDAEWARVVLRAPSIRLRSEPGALTVEHRARDGASFTVREVVDAIVETERRTRSDSRWLGGIDVHHVFFEGIEREDDGTWSIHWGS